MSITPLMDLPFAITLHLWAALLAILLGPIALYRRRRDLAHRITGYAWVMAMATLAASSFWVEAQILPLVGGYGPIHLLSVWVFVVLARAVAAARAGRIRDHQTEMRSLYWTGLLVAGLFTLMPYRILNRALFPDTPEAGYWAVALCAAALLWANLRDRQIGRQIGRRTRAATERR